VEPNPDHGIGPLADLLADYVIVERVLVAEDHAVIQGVCWLLLGWQRRLYFGLVSSCCIVHVLSLPLLQL